MLAKEKSTVFDFWLCQGAFVRSGEDTSFTLFVIALSECLQLFLQGVGVDQDAVDVSSRENAYVLENIVHRLLKCRMDIHISNGMTL